MDVIAHRGNSGAAPENTLAAFRQVAETGAQGAEFDVQLSRDGVPVVIHDEKLERTSTGTGWVGEHTAAELHALDAGRWFGPAFAGERIPTLEEVLNVFLGTPLRLIIELKTNRIPYPGLAALTVALVRRLGMTGQTVVSSFNHATLLEARAAAPEMEYAALVSDRLIEPWVYARRHGFAALHPRASAVDAEVVERCHQAGLKVRVWTVDDPVECARLERLGVDAVITNHPGRLARR
jgi:glycerophosphoryl diester phosphodiesterase